MNYFKVQHLFKSRKQAITDKFARCSLGFNKPKALKHSPKALHWIKYLVLLKYRKQFWVVSGVHSSNMSPIKEGCVIIIIRNAEILI